MVHSIHPRTNQEVKEKADIVDVISEHIVLKKKGKEFVGICPFHDDTKPSMTVSPRKQIYYCFSCGAGGNSIKFLMEFTRANFSDVVLSLAKKNNINVENFEGPQAEAYKKQLSRKEELYKILRVTKNWFKSQLNNSLGFEAMKYLTSKRNLSNKIIDDFELGFAPNSWNDLFNYLSKVEKFPINLILASGLAISKDNSDKIYDRFRNRLIVPIHDMQGRVVAFGGRSLDGQEPKYLNSPESEIFEKGKMLFAFEKASSNIRKRDKAIIVEGYFDVISLHAKGIANSVASLGTALNKYQISQLCRCTDNKNIILIIPLNYEGEIWKENIKISVNNEFLTIKEEIYSFLNQFHFSKNFKIKEILTFEKALKYKFKEYKIETKKIISRSKCRGFIYIFSKDFSRQSITEDSNFNFIENCLAVGLENHHLIQTKKKHENIDREISTGAEIQSQLLPDYCPIIHGIDLAAHCRPALQLGGDYYDFMCLKTNISEKRKEKSKWAFVIGDVMGKGIPAGLLMTMLRGMLRAEVLTGLPPDRILHDLNHLAINDLDQSHRFVTLFYSDYDPRTRKLRFANAAHNPPLLWKSTDQKVFKLDAKGFVLGLQKDAEYHCGEIKLNQNDLVLYYTDGVIDTSNSLGQRFDEERLIKILTKLCKQSYTSQEILNKIFKKLDDFTGQNRHLEDDASMVIFQLK